MTPSQVEELLGEFKSRKRPYYYYSEKYAVDLISNYMGDGIRITDLKKSPMGRFLKKKTLQQITSHLSGNFLSQNDLAAHWPESTKLFKITLDKWGEKTKHRKDWWFQTTRPGYNLVVQLNFTDESHTGAYRKIMKPYLDLFGSSCHPILEKGGITMAWARIDLDLERGEALIEEVQNDWLKEAKNEVKWIFWREKWDYNYVHKSNFLWASDASMNDFLRYYYTVLQPFEKIWDEAMLMATIQFIRDELGIRKIWYHTYEGGKVFKGHNPPRSVYSGLPKKFGFSKTEVAPLFIRRCKFLKRKLYKNPNLKWYYLEG